MNDDFYKKELLSGGIFVVLIGVACIMSMFYTKPALSRVETPVARDLLQGKWCSQFENSFRQTFPINTASRNLWGRAEYAFFHEGRKGVVIGTNGWLFTDEEFSCPAKAAQNLDENLDFIHNTQKTLAQKNTRLAVVLVPEKARIFSAYTGQNSLPACRKDLYATIHDFLLLKGIVTTNLLPAMHASPAHESLYLKTDTHWSPAGARLAAQVTAQLVHVSFNDLELESNTFLSQKEDEKDYEGDLTHYIPGVSIQPDHIVNYVSSVAVASAGAPQDLFADSTPSVALVGTSYSFNPAWNFEGFLKEALKTDVLNMSDEGLGPLVVMDKYLKSAEWNNTPPRLLIWEIPERYLVMPHGVAS